MVDALRGDPHGAFSLVQRPLQVLPGLHQVVGLIHVAFQFRLKNNKIEFLTYFQTFSVLDCEMFCMLTKYDDKKDKIGKN